MSDRLIMKVATPETQNSRNHLIKSLVTGLIIGGIIGAPLGWFIHRFYAEQRLGQILICREKNRNQPEAMVQSICGSWF